MKRIKTFGGTVGLGLVLCAACCALPLTGPLGSAVVLSVTDLSGGLEGLLLAFLGIAGIGFWVDYRRRIRSAACKTSCETGCGCRGQAKRPYQVM